MRVSIFAKPGSKKGPLVESTENNEYTVYIKERAVDGKANEALIELLAAHFSVRKADVRVISGNSSRKKIVEIDI